MGGSSGEDAHHASIVTVLVAILVMVLQIIIIAIFGMYVWNGVIAGKNGLLPFVNEATSIWQLIGHGVLRQQLAALQLQMQGMAAAGVGRPRQQAPIGTRLIGKPGVLEGPTPDWCTVMRASQRRHSAIQPQSWHIRVGAKPRRLMNTRT